MKAAIVATWIAPVPGREKEGIEYTREVDDFWAKQAADGRCSEPEWFWALRGPNMWIVKGEYDELLAVMSTPEAQRLMTKGSFFVQHFECELVICGREERMALFEEVARELHYV